MTIRTVEYKRLRTIEGAYENETIGAVAEVGEGETPAEVLARLADWVNVRLSERIAETRARDEERHEVANAKYELRQVEQDIEQAKQRWKQIQEFAKKFDIELQEIPF